MRLELRDGQWAELRERITHGVDKEIRRSRLIGQKDDSRAYEVTTVLVRAFVREWRVDDPDGKPINLEDADAIDRAPDDIIDAIFEKAAALWTAVTVPNAPTPASSDGSS